MEVGGGVKVRLKTRGGKKGEGEGGRRIAAKFSQISSYTPILLYTVLIIHVHRQMVVGL